MKQYYAEVEKDSKRIKKEIEILEDKISKAGDDKKELEQELSRAYFKLAICEGILTREKEK